MKTTILTTLALAILTLSVHGGDFDVIFEGHGDIESYIYFNQDENYFIDTELNVNVETIRYKRFFLMADLFKETHMGRKYNSNMVFDPNRMHWSFGLSGRIELEKYFLEAQLHHDCFHTIDRWNDKSIYWNSPRLGFGTIGYLPKYKYHEPLTGSNELTWENRLDYYVLAGFFAPKGISFQKNHDYDFTLNTDFRYLFFKYKRLGISIDLYNLWVFTNDNDFERQHRIDLNSIIYGDRGVMEIFFRFWPYDNQSIRSRATHKWAFGFQFGF